jgi:hypothetical protein
MTTATRIGELGAPVRFIKAILGFAPSGSLWLCKSDPVRFVRLWAPFISKARSQMYGLFYCLSNINRQ